jgi:hypothetical protein
MDSEEIDMPSPISPQQAAELAVSVYTLRETLANGMSQSRAMGIANQASPLSNGIFDIAGGTRIGGTSGVGPIAENSGFAMVARGRGNRAGEALLAVRGTDSTADIVTDIFTRVEEGATGSGVHGGFSRVYDSIDAGVTSAIRGLGASPTTIHVVGHSLGGAIATIAASRLSQNGHNVKLYTFGSPRVGLGLFAGAATDRIRPENVFRVHHTADPVTMAPIFPFIHVPVRGTHYRLNWTGDTVSVNAHLMGSYIRSIGQSNWGALAHATANMDTVADIEAWLEFAASGAATIMPMQSSVLSLVGQALNWMVQAAAGLGIGAALLGEYVADTIAAMIHRVAQLVARFGVMLRNIVTVIMRLLGRTMASIQDMTVSFLRWVLSLLFNRIAGLARRAIQRVG